MQQPVVQMHQQAVPTPRHFEPLIPFHAHLKPDYFAALQQQQHQLQQQHQNFHGHHQYLSQGRAARPQGAYIGASETLHQRSFPIRSSQPTSSPDGSRVSHSHDHQLHRQNRHTFAPAATAVARNTSFLNNNASRNLVAERLQEHQLRRKTPSGTIDAGYDGSPASLATGPPPFKQMALSATSTIFPTPVVHQDGSAHDLQHQRVHFGDLVGGITTTQNGIGQKHISLSGSNWPFQTGNNASSTNAAPVAVAAAAAANIANVAGDQVPLIRAGPLLAQQRANNNSNLLVQPVFAPSYQPSPGPTAFNSCSFDPRPLWPDSALLQGYQPPPQPFLLSSMSNMGNNMSTNTNNNISSSSLGLVPQNVVCDSAFISAAQPMFSPVGLNNDSVHQVVMPGQQAAFRFSSSAPQRNNGTYPRNIHNQDQNMETQNALQSPIQALEMLSVGPASGVPIQGLSIPGEAPVQFKERILAHAESTYADLLLYLTHTKKSLNGKALPSLRAHPKLAIFSKLAQQQQLQLRQQLQQRHIQGHSLSGSVQDQIIGASTPHSQHGANLQHAMPSAAVTAGLASNIAARKFQPHMRRTYGFPHSPNSDMFSLHAPLVLQAKTVLEVLSNLCEQSGWKWVDGMLLGGCLHYALEHFERALEWFRRIFALRPDFVEVMSNIAATLHCLDRREEAVKYWSHAIRAKPSYLESAEHLTTVLSAEHRHREAVEIVSFVQNSLRLQKPGGTTTANSSSNNTKRAELEIDVSKTASVLFAATSVNSDSAQHVNHTSSPLPDSPDVASTQPGFGSSGYAVPGHDNGRMIGLIHTKANILYAMKETSAASEAYEEAVLIGAGRSFRSVQNLILRIRTALSPENPQESPRSYFSRPSSGPPLLPPETAKGTARRAFPYTNGQLPGLRYILDIYHKKTAIATTSNALLSMAKILQDGMASNGYSSQGSNNQSTAVGDILALYYLSMSLQESPSTANNVGILLASVQQSPALKPSQLPKPNQNTPQQQQRPLQKLQLPRQQQQHRQPHQPQTLSATVGAVNATYTVPSGIAPGSGLALAFAYYNYGLQLDPKHVHLHTNLGSLLKDVGHLDLAIKMYEQAVACDSTFDIALTNLANAVKDRGRVAEAIVYYRRAVASNPEFTEAVCGLSTALNSVCDWSGRGGVVLYNGRYDRWHVDDDGMLQDVRQHGRGSGLMKRVVDIVARQLREGSMWGRGVLHDSAIAMLACQMKEAIGAANLATIKGKGKENQDDHMDVAAELQKWAGQPWEGSRVIRLIERATRVVMRRWYHDRYVLGAESPNGYARPRPPASLAVPGAPTVLPFHTFTCPLPAKEVRLISQRNAVRISCSTLRSPWLSGSVYPPPAPPQPQLNIGYISSDFNNHPLAHLMQSVFGFHDPSRAKAFCYATTVGDKSAHRQKIEREAPVFRDVTNWPPDRLIEQIIQDGIHILVNLNGYTRGARNEIFAARPAPIQMAFMGFAGTLGAEWCDYLLADTAAVPPSTLKPWRGNVSISDVFHDESAVDAEKWIYSENIIYCRDTFFCCDHKQSAEASERTVTWKGEQHRRWRMRKELFPNLSDDIIILGNFNQLYKIDPTTFRSWLRILAGVPNAVLWLLRFPELGEINLRKTATLWAGKSVADRIIFTDVAPKHLHITRARICDLFLDTPECNAHTTAADVLWSSTPLLTLPRYEYKMCSRIASSVLKGALPKDAAGKQAAAELIADDENHYEKLAIKLASSLSYRLVSLEDVAGGEMYGEGSGRLADLRELLWHHKWTCGLFDTQRWVSDLEDAYEEAWRRWISGERGDIYL